jgi:putative hydrolase of the HAD superfamily
MVSAVLFDAFGTLVELEDPVGRLQRGLADAGYADGADVVASAFAREVAHYRRHQDLGRDAAGLDVLRTECASVFAEALTSSPPVAEAQVILLDALRFRVFADVVPTLDALAAAGLRLGVVSNWDASLPDVLDDVGILDRFASVSASAVVGARKPDPAIFRHALSVLDLEPGQVFHVGDSPELDVGGAGSAGIRAVVIDRHSRTDPDRAVSSLTELPRLFGVA